MVGFLLNFLAGSKAFLPVRLPVRPGYNDNYRSRSYSFVERQKVDRSGKFAKRKVFFTSNHSKCIDNANSPELVYHLKWYADQELEDQVRNQVLNSTRDTRESRSSIRISLSQVRQLLRSNKTQLENCCSNYACH